MSFLGYRRPDGTVGIRNHVLVLPEGLVAAKICDFVAGARTIITTDSGSGSKLEPIMQHYEVN